MRYAIITEQGIESEAAAEGWKWVGLAAYNEKCEQMGEYV